VHERNCISCLLNTDNRWRLVLGGFRRIQGLLELRPPMLDRNREAMYCIESVEVIHPQNNFMDDRGNKRSPSTRHFVILAEIDRSAGPPHCNHTLQPLHLNHPSRHRLLLSFYGDQTSVHLSLDKSHLDADSEVVDIRRAAELHASLLHL
jgi:hypothetical protein